MTSQNAELQLAHDFIQNTGCNIFLTGKAGTGKTTFLHNLKETAGKRMIVTAPTGVAAINAGGVTLHSFFQMPMGPFIPGSENTEQERRRKFSKEKINLIRSLDLLVIDEISMVRADLLDGVDSVLRRYRRSSEPFGGVQLLMIGDLHQLPPVVKRAEWDLLREHYESIYFFSSNALRQTQPVTIELKHIYRQTDADFIKLLNRVRGNSLDPASLNELNRRYLPDWQAKDQENCITLCTHNSRAEGLNQARLRAMPKKMLRYAAEIEGDFPEYSYPAPALLELKEGAQVMFVRNDQSHEKLFYNGKIGTVSHASANTIRIKCPDSPSEITVEKTTWENIHYKVDPQSKEITANKIGTFRQYPLKLAWAITIHKSQGLTFEKAVIDAQSAFAHGQVYVALSRCKSLAGMVLSAPITPEAIKTDAAVSNYTNSHGDNPSREQLETAKTIYQQRLILECFHFHRLRYLLNRFVSLLARNIKVLHLSGGDNVQETATRANTEIFVVGENFNRQLEGIFTSNKSPSDDPIALERLTKASAYFQEKINAILADFLGKLKFDTDNKEVEKTLEEAFNQLRAETAIKLAAVKCCQNGFSPALYLRAISAVETAAKRAKSSPKTTASYTEADIGHPELFQTLKSWRSEKAEEEDVPRFRIMHQSVLIQIAINLPDNILDLVQIKGIGKRLAEKYGQEIIKLVSEYRKKHGITEVILPEPGVKKTAPIGKSAKISSTKEVSFEMFKNGLNMEQIAAKRGLAKSTIETHLCFFVEKGEVKINDVVPLDKIEAIEEQLAKMLDTPLGAVKSALGDGYSYGEIKLVQCHQNFLNLIGQEK